MKGWFLDRHPCGHNFVTLYFLFRVVEVHRERWRRQWILLCERSPKLDAQMRPHWGHATATVGSGFPSLRAWRLRSRSCKRFFSNASTPLWTPSRHAQRSTVRVSQFGVVMPQAPKDAFRQSLNLLSGCPMFRVPEASSVKHSTLLSLVPSITMLGSGGGVRAGAGWSITSVFRRLMVSPKALAASDRQLASSCRSGSFTATRAQSSAKRKSRTRASRTLVLALRRLRSKNRPSHL